MRTKTQEINPSDLGLGNVSLVIILKAKKGKKKK